MVSAKSGSKPATDPPASGLTSDIASARRRALVAGHTGDTSGALELLCHPEPSVRQAALGALASAGNLDTRLILDALVDQSWTVRRRACELAGRIAITEVAEDGTTAGALLDQSGALLDLLVETLADREPLVAETAAWALGELTLQVRATGHARCVDSLGVMATKHADPLCREAAVAALGAIGDPSSIDYVLAALGDKPPIRRRATVALAAFEDPRVDAALNDCLTDRDWQVRQAAEDILGRMD
jgi:HEAT repeat protein